MGKTLQRRKTAVISIEQAAEEFLARHNHWSPSEYRLEEQGLSADGRYLRVWAIHRDDEKDLMNVRPGGGKSVSLQLDPQTHRVIRQLHFQ